MPIEEFSMYESLSSQFFRTTTGIQSGAGTFDESRFVMSYRNMQFQTSSSEENR